LSAGAPGSERLAHETARIVPWVSVDAKGSPLFSGKRPKKSFHFFLIFCPAEQFTPDAQRFLFQLRVLRSFGNGALEGVDQLGNSREDRTFVGGARGVTILQPAFDGFPRHRVSNRGLTICHGQS
jgi:hypothetical protein